MKTVTLTMSFDDANNIVKRLAKYPYEEVFHLVRTIETQVMMQMAPTSLERPVTGRLAPQGDEASVDSSKPT